MAIAPERLGIGIGIRRHFTTGGVHPYEMVTWERRDARITNFRDGSVAFEQLDVEVPSTWSLNATNILAQKYFRGTLGTAERETSLKQVVDRIVDTVLAWGNQDGYFTDEEQATAFSDDLKYLLITQRAAFNSPVWFNIGVKDVPQQGSACFILSVDDQMRSILNWYTEEGIIFKGGSGAGVNISKIRSSRELLQGGGTASGPVSFMRGADASAGTIKSGGKTRRAAKMVILDVDHPDIKDFIWCKTVEERKARVLRDNGFDMDLDGKDSHSIQYQNANNSVRVTDEFMQAVIDDADWHLRAVTDGSIIETVKARDLFRQISQAAWECADPGMQFDTTINKWHTAATTGRINGSNPCCFTGETLVETVDGPVEFERLYKIDEAGLRLPEAVSFDVAGRVVTLGQINKVWIAGHTDSLINVRTTAGVVARCTPEHRFLMADGRWVEAKDLAVGDRLRAAAGAAAIEDTVEAVNVELLDEPVAVYDLEVDGTHNFGIAGPASSMIVHNSEYMHLDNSACNLASLNLMTFLDDDDRFDVEAFKAATSVVFTAQEIIVGNGDYPTAKIAKTTRRFRQLGIGYANLGALLMAQGLAYDSDAGRAWAGAITALLTGHSYATSARTAARMGPFAGFQENRVHMLKVLGMHRDAVNTIDEELVPVELLDAAREVWDDAVNLGEEHGVRNSQASVLAPTGCLVPGTLVLTDRGLVRLGNLGDTEGAQWQPLDAQVQTDEGPRTATQFYVNGLETVVNVTTARGYGIKGTTKHRIKIVDENGEWQWRRFADLRPGDMVPLTLGQMVGEPHPVTLPPLAETMAWAAEHHVTTPTEMTVELAELAGYFMGDGSLHAKGLRLCVAAEDDDVVDVLCRLSKELFGIAPTISAKKGYTEVAINSVRLTEWWQATGLAKRRPTEDHSGKGWTPRIPDAVLHTNDPAVYRAFLRGLFEADGTVGLGYPSWTTTSVSFAEEVQTLMLALGFVTTRRQQTSGRGSLLQHVRLLNVESVERFRRQIGFISMRKDRALHTAATPQAARYDHIPVTRELIDRVCPVNGRNRRVALMEFSRSRSVTRRLARELYAASNDGELGHLLGFFFDTIRSAELGDDEFTYDISVPDNVTYVANGFVSHNTIGLLMDCDTTGIEPDLGLVKMKKLVGGGTMSIVNQTVPRALTKLGYSDEQIDEIQAYIGEQKSILGAPHLSPSHYDVFACSMGDNTIHYRGHIKMMAAAQPFLSGAISKTVNMPEDVTVEHVEQLHIEAWQLGLKAVAIYRDNCKVAQPLATAKKGHGKEGFGDDPALIGTADGAPTDAVLAAKVVELEQEIARHTVFVKQPVRERLPNKRRSTTTKFRVADCEGYFTVGEYDDGRPGEVFISVSKQGSTLSGLMDAFAVSISLGLQHGVPLSTYVKKYSNSRFEPSGMTDDPELRIATSLMDYIFRRIAVDYMPIDERTELGILTQQERLQPTLPGVEEATVENHSSDAVGQVTLDLAAGLAIRAAAPAPAAVEPPKMAAPKQNEVIAPLCYSCGNEMQRAGSCYVCGSCGSTSGCS